MGETPADNYRRRQRMKIIAVTSVALFLLMVGGVGSIYAKPFSAGTEAFLSEGEVTVTMPQFDVVDLVITIQGTEIVNMELKGELPEIGEVIVRAGEMYGLHPTVGLIEELVPGIGDEAAYSFFDVYFEIDIPALQITAQNAEPVPIEAVIEEIPPLGNPYKKDIVIQVLDPRTGAFVLEITSFRHTPKKDPPVPQKRSVRKLTTAWGKLKSDR
jgi:hypothetical protein